MPRIQLGRPGRGHWRSLRKSTNCQLMLMAGLAKRGAACGSHLCTIGPFPGQPLRPGIRARFSCALAMPESRASWVRQSLASQQAQALLHLCWPIWARIRSGNKNTPTISGDCWLALKTLQTNLLVVGRLMPPAMAWMLKMKMSPLLRSQAGLQPKRLKHGSTWRRKCSLGAGCSNHVGRTTSIAARCSCWTRAWAR